MAATESTIDLTGGYPEEWDYSVVVPPDDDPWFGENYALWLWDEENSLGFHFYLKTLGHLGLYHVRRETINVHLPDGTVLMAEADGRGNTDSRIVHGANLQAECVEPFRRWHYRYDATAQPTTASEMREGLLRHLPLVPLGFELEGLMALPPALTGSFIPGEDAERARKFYGTRRYEQFIRGTGAIRANGREYSFSGVGMRTHRIGTRNLTEFPGHTWTMGLFPSNRAFCLNRICGGDGVAFWEEGYVSDGRKLYPARTNGEMTLYSTELAGESLVCELESELGSHSIRGTLRATNFTTLFPEDQFRFCWGIDKSNPRSLIMPQGLAVYELDGEQGAGMIERSVHVDELPLLGL